MMASNNEQPSQFLQTPAVTALKKEDAENRAELSRSPSMDMKAEREELKTAAEQSLNVILDLGLDGIVRWVSPSWKEVVGTLPEHVKGKPIENLLLSSKDAFANAIESMRNDDSKSRIIRFCVSMGPHSVLRENASNADDANTRPEGADVKPIEAPDQEQILNLKGQGILVYDRTSGGESHVSCERSKIDQSLWLTASSPCGCCAHRLHQQRSQSICPRSWLNH